MHSKTEVDQWLRRTILFFIGILFFFEVPLRADSLPLRTGAADDLYRRQEEAFYLADQLVDNLGQYWTDLRQDPIKAFSPQATSQSLQSARASYTRLAVLVRLHETDFFDRSQFKPSNLIYRRSILIRLSRAISDVFFNRLQARGVSTPANPKKRVQLVTQLLSEPTPDRLLSMGDLSVHHEIARLRSAIHHNQASIPTPVRDVIVSIEHALPSEGDYANLISALVAAKKRILEVLNEQNIFDVNLSWLYSLSQFSPISIQQAPKFTPINVIGAELTVNPIRRAVVAARPQDELTSQLLSYFGDVIVDAELLSHILDLPQIAPLKITFRTQSLSPPDPYTPNHLIELTVELREGENPPTEFQLRFGIPGDQKFGEPLLDNTAPEWVHTLRSLLSPVIRDYLSRMNCTLPFVETLALEEEAS